MHDDMIHNPTTTKLSCTKSSCLILLFVITIIISICVYIGIGIDIV
jgi:hypothetical protein